MNKLRIISVDLSEMKKFFCVPMHRVYQYTNPFVLLAEQNSLDYSEQKTLSLN